MTLDAAFRSHGPRVLAALATRYRDLDLAEEAVAEACARAAALWPAQGPPNDPAAWLYRVADRAALQALRRRATRQRLQPDPPPPAPTAEDALCEDAAMIPDERLRLIFICCHPAVAPESRAALTLRMVCGLTAGEIADAFLVTETALVQRLVRAKRKIAEAGVPFETPGPAAWPERMEAVLSTLEIAYAKAHEDAAGAARHAGYASEMLRLTALLAELAPDDAPVAALAALVRYAEARRLARLDPTGAMTPLSDQDPRLWDRTLIADAHRYLARARGLAPDTPRVLQAALHGAWCARPSLAAPAPWPAVLAIYDRLMALRDDVFVRLNRAVALAEVAGPGTALEEVDTLNAEQLRRYGPYHAVRADFLRRLARRSEALAAYDAALGLEPPPAERLWLERRRAALADA